MFGQRSFVIIYFKVTVLKNSLTINSLDVSSPASKRELRVNTFQAVRMDSGTVEPQMSCFSIPVSSAGSLPIKTHQSSSASISAWSPSPGRSPRSSSALHTPSRWPAPALLSCCSEQGLWIPPVQLDYTRQAP